MLLLGSAARAAEHEPAAKERARAPETPAAAAVNSAPTPVQREIRVLIDGLTSVRDYERLRWILDAINAQSEPPRAELLAYLDDQVQRLLQPEASAHPPLTPAPVTQPPTPALAVPAARPPKSAAQIRQALEAAHPSQDLANAKAAVRDAQLDLDQVKDPVERAELSRLLNERTQEIKAAFHPTPEKNPSLFPPSGDASSTP